jgi:hypothetical protein
MPVTREFFALDFPPMIVLTSAVGVASITGALMFASLRAVEWSALAPEILQSRKVQRMERKVEVKLQEVEMGIEGWVQHSWRSIRSIFSGKDDLEE